MPEPTTKSGITAADLRGYLFGIVCHLKKAESFSDSYLEDKVRQAEDQLARDLGILFQKTVIKCEPQSGDAFDLEEPAYDYDSDFFLGERWGWLRVRRYPVRSVERMVFAFPNIESKVFTVPASWIRLDKLFGVIRLVPAQAAIYAPMTAYLLSLMGGGRDVPQAIFVDYTAGFDGPNEIKLHDQDILELIKRLAVLEIAADGLLPSSFASSGDGISQSFSWDLKTYREDTRKKESHLRDRIKGVRLAVV